jgi:mRNA interferase MazF
VVVRVPRDKARPAVVVRADLFADLSYATVVPITSDLYEGVALRINLEPTAENGLRVPSQVMVDWPITLRFSDMGEVIGRLDVATMRTITQQLAVMLGIGAGTGRSHR